MPTVPEVLVSQPSRTSQSSTGSAPSGSAAGPLAQAEETSGIGIPI
jgi:hypothetical protein